MRRCNIILPALSATLACCGQQGVTLQNNLAGNPATLAGTAVAPPAGNKICTRFQVPEGYARVSSDTNSFAHYLRNLPLKPEGTGVKYFDGREKSELVHEAVVDMDIGNKDLQQCADAIMRLRGEYFYARKEYDKISFVFTNGFRAGYAEWIKGNRIQVSGNKTSWKKTAMPSNTYADFRNFMNVVFSYAGTLSMSKTLKPKNISDIAISDAFVHGGLPGHAVLVVDMAESASGEKIFMVAQSFMPAQDIHVLKNYVDESISPWYRTGADGLSTPQWSFAANELMSFD